MGFVSIPAESRFWLVNGRIPHCLLAPHSADPNRADSAELKVIPALAKPPLGEALVAVDVEIVGGQVGAIAAPGTAPPDMPQVDLRQGLIWPCFVDLHTHLDKGQIWNRQPNPDGTFASALTAALADAQHHWTEEELYRRIDFSLRCAYAHGTQALRTHFDAGGPEGARTLAVLTTLQRQWAGRVAIQIVNLVDLDHYFTPAGVALADQMAAIGGILGGVSYANPNLAAQVERVFDLATERGLDLDLHVDESLDPADNCLRLVAEAKVRRQFAGAVVCGHCCSLGVQSPAVMAATLQWVQQAAMAIVSLPMCNLYLQDRQPGRMPRQRGVAPLHEIHQASIPLAIASDNCRDPFNAYGDLDGLEVFTQAVRIGHLDRPFGLWPRAITTTPAELMGLPQAGRIGQALPAELILFSARTLNELLCRPQGDRVVLRQGRAIDTTLPDYRELDDLLGIA